MGQRLANIAQPLALVALCAVCAELLAAYSDNTGDPGATAFALVFFSALYGAPALLVRELVRRSGWGWPSLLLLCTALAVLQACIVDQSLFAQDYRGYDGWKENRAMLFLPGLGFGLNQAFAFISGHVIFSFAGPIAIAEAWRPRVAQRSWLGPIGMAIAAFVWLATAAAILIDPASAHASPAQFAGAWAVVVLLVLTAVRLGQRTARRAISSRGGDRSILILAASFAVAVLGTLAGEGVTGLLVGLLSLIVGGFSILAVGRRFGWSPCDSAAVALGFLLSRGVFAFTYFPLLGEVEPAAKYAHNAVMLAAVAVAGIIALSRPPLRTPA